MGIIDQIMGGRKRRRGRKSPKRTVKRRRKSPKGTVKRKRRRRRKR